MQITLSEEEAQLLKELLQAELAELPVENHHTQSHDVKALLKDREALVKNLLARFESPVQTG